MNSAMGAPSRPLTVHARTSGSIELEVEALGEGKAEQAARDIKGRFDHLLELQIGLELALVEVELDLAPLLGEIAPIPGGDLEVAALAGGDFLQRLLLLAGAGDAGRPNRFEKIERSLGRFRHRVGEAIVRVSLIAEQPRALGPQAHHFGGDLAIVRRAAVFAARGPGAKGGLAQIAPRRELQERLDARSRQSDGVFAGMAAIGGGARGAGDEEIRQAVEIGLGEQHEPVFFVLEHILPELSAERRQPLGDRGETRLGLRRQTRAGAGEIEMIALEHARLFGRKPEFVSLRLQSVDALEQRVVEIGLVAMAREDRRDLALDRLQFIIGRRACEIEEDTSHPLEAAPAALERLDRVGEGRGRRVCGDGVDFVPRVLQRSLKSGPEMTRLDALERRRLERPGPGFKQRIAFDARRGHQRSPDERDAQGHGTRARTE